MVTIEINGKEYNFLFNANTCELYYQTFNEDLFELTIKSKDDTTLLLRRNRLVKLAYIGNMQTRKTVRELCGHMNMTTYMDWADQFNNGAFLTGEAAEKLVTAWNDSFNTKSQEKNPASPQ